MRSTNGGQAMPMTREQAVLVAKLVNAIRPSWDTQGVLENLKPLASREPAQVAMAAIRAAVDEGAATPGVIPKDGPHWHEKVQVGSEAARHTSSVPISEVCDHCGRSEAHCRDTATDHEYVTAAQLRARADKAARNPERPTDERRKPLLDATRREIAAGKRELAARQAEWQRRRKEDA